MSVRSKVAGVDEFLTRMDLAEKFALCARIFFLVCQCVHSRTAFQVLRYNFKMAMLTIFVTVKSHSLKSRYSIL